MSENHEQRAVKLVKERLEIIALLAEGTKYGTEADLQAIRHHIKQAIRDISMAPRSLP